ncbi:MAG: Rieske (2Fe-2S) protein [Fluviicola sp.]|nr:Rieske (2Fe-2S) protein [Fluviicola sp.]
MRSCGYACLSGIAVTTILQSCATTKIVSGSIDQSELVIDLADFEQVKKKQSSFRNYLIVRNDSLQFPLAIYRFSDTEYTALYLKCTHQGAELQVFGDKIQCPAHGSEFSNRGVVESGPATEKLREFAVRIDNKQLKISLV